MSEGTVLKEGIAYTMQSDNAISIQAGEYQMMIYLLPDGILETRVYNNEGAQVEFMIVEPGGGQIDEED